MDKCKEWRGFHTCDGGLYVRDGIALCGAHYRAKYAFDYGDSSLYKVGA